MEIFEAIIAGNLNELRQAINRGANVNQRLGEIQNSPLHIAVVVQDNLPIVQELLNRGAQVNAQNSEQDTPLHIAAERNVDIAIVQELINRDADLEVRNEDNETPLHLAVSPPNACSLEITQLLLKNEANVHAVGGEFGFSPLHYSVSSNNLDDAVIDSEIVQVLIYSGADVNGLSEQGETPLHVAVNDAPNANDILQMLIDAGANINATDQYLDTPMHLAAQSIEINALETIRLLVLNDANTNALDNHNRTPLDLMALNPLESVVNYAENMVAVQNLTPLNREQLEQNQNQQQLGAMIIPMNQDEVAPNNGNQARRNAPEQEQQNDQNERRVLPRR